LLIVNEDHFLLHVLNRVAMTTATTSFEAYELTIGMF